MPSFNSTLAPAARFKRIISWYDVLDKPLIPWHDLLEERRWCAETRRSLTGQLAPGWPPLRSPAVAVKLRLKA